MSRYSRSSYMPVATRPPPAPRSHSGPANMNMATFYKDSTAEMESGYTRCSSSRFSSRATTPTLQDQGSRTSSRSRSPTPGRPFSDMLIKVSQKQRQRSIPPPPPPLERIEPSYIPPGAFGGGKPLPPPRVVNTDFYRGKVKSIYEREPLFQDYSRSVEHKGYSMYNSGDLRTMKQEFKSMVEDKFDKRMNHGDPAVDRDFGRKLYPWRNTFAADSTPASERLAHTHAERARREITPVNKPRLFVYHRSTQNLPPPSHIYIR